MYSYISKHKKCLLFADIRLPLIMCNIANIQQISQKQAEREK
nr:MAG TPA: hypothetical protein [Caudoviricetes sp.]